MDEDYGEEPCIEVNGGGPCPSAEADGGGEAKVRQSLWGYTIGCPRGRGGISAWCITPRSCGAPCEFPEPGLKAVRGPRVESDSRFKVQFDVFAMAVIASRRSLTQAAELLLLHWDRAQQLIDQAVVRRLALGPT